MKQILLVFIRAYQLLVSPIFTQVLGARCRFEKTCSEYALNAIENEGIVKGSEIAIRRIVSCRPGKAFNV